MGWMRPRSLYEAEASSGEAEASGRTPTEVLPPANEPKDNSPLTWTARIASLLFHPLWLPLVYIIWQNWGDPLIAFIITPTLSLIVFPGLVTLFWMSIRLETDWFAMSQRNRIVPLGAGLCGTVLFAIANNEPMAIPIVQYEFHFLLLLALSVSILITLFWKISLHMLGWGIVNAICLVHALESGNWIPFVFSLPLTVLVAWARLRVKSHDRLQIVVGWGAGVVIAGVIVIAFP